MLSPLFATSTIDARSLLRFDTTPGALRNIFNHFFDDTFRGKIKIFHLIIGNHPQFRQAPDEQFRSKEHASRICFWKVCFYSISNCVANRNKSFPLRFSDSTVLCRYASNTNIGILSVSASPRDTVIFGWLKDRPVFVSVIMAFPFFNCRIASNASPCPFNPFSFSIPRNFTALEKYILPLNNRLTYLRSPNFTKSTLLLSILLTPTNFA